MSFVFLLVFLLGASPSFMQAKTGDACLSVKAAAPQGSPALLFRAIKKLDADIQKCVEDKLGNSELKSDGITVKVSGGEAVLEGKSKTPGHKGSAGKFAKGCGAQKVTNNIIITRNPPVH